MSHYLAILGRQPALSIAELERAYGSAAVTPFSATACCFAATTTPDVQTLGGSPKIGRQIASLHRANWQEVSTKIVQHYTPVFKNTTGKITLGISVYDWRVAPRDIQKLGLRLKSIAKQHGASLRLIPNKTAQLSSATSHHNKLGLSANKIELIVVQDTTGSVVLAESCGTQNITALATRDQGRPKRDAFVGMLPPKLALMMVNIAAGTTHKRVASGGADNPIPTLLDPFCGTGVILQEAALQHYRVYGTDLSEKMIRYSRDNLNWLQDTQRTNFDWYLHEGDAMTTTWRQPIHAVATEAYLGQPFSAPPSPAKLTQVRGNCNHIISTFLQNIGQQISPGTPLCIAIPAWRAHDGSFTHLPLIQKLSSLGYRCIALKHVRPSELLYYRETQVVARELLLLEKI